MGSYTVMMARDRHSAASPSSLLNGKGAPEVKRVRLALFVALGWSVVLLAAGAAFAAEREYVVDYLYPSNAKSDLVSHNHNFNRVRYYVDYWCASLSDPFGLFETTSSSGTKWQLNGNGCISYSHGNGWYTAPWCWNRGDNIIAVRCLARW